MLDRVTGKVIALFAYIFFLFSSFYLFLFFINKILEFTTLLIAKPSLPQNPFVLNAWEGNNWTNMPRYIFVFQTKKTKQDVCKC